MRLGQRERKGGGRGAVARCYHPIHTDAPRQSFCSSCCGTEMLHEICSLHHLHMQLAHKAICWHMSGTATNITERLINRFKYKIACLSVNSNDVIIHTHAPPACHHEHNEYLFIKEDRVCRRDWAQSSTLSQPVFKLFNQKWVHFVLCVSYWRCAALRNLS